MATRARVAAYKVCWIGGCFSTDILAAIDKVVVKPSPVVAAFSSRGPNSITPNILKPDLVSPGVNILAGWSGVVGPTGLAGWSSARWWLMLIYILVL
ncbi:hypothetical protein CFOL_v3_16718 [Cephalotus follicularis]|uniref:Uncharacterized protein n=1 Tax=Cephalotus follicularis TaxID=3775 RepID=A0A1Q3BZB1_CEPFO|nr:hypothetical protein CFOL_v3_16718 [Cephalotus follicularis]